MEFAQNAKRCVDAPLVQLPLVIFVEHTELSYIPGSAEGGMNERLATPNYHTK